MTTDAHRMATDIRRSSRKSVRVNLRFGPASEKWLVDALAGRKPYERAKFLRRLIRLGSQAVRSGRSVIAPPSKHETMRAKEAPTTNDNVGQTSAFDEAVLGGLGKTIRE